MTHVQETPLTHERAIKNLFSLERAISKQNDDDGERGFAMKHWTEKVKDIESQQERMTVRKNDMKTELYQVIGFYSVLQGVLFQGVAQLGAQAALCDVLMFALFIGLSGLASAATILSVIFKLQEIYELQSRIADKEVERQDYTIFLRGLRGAGCAYQWPTGTLDGTYRAQLKHKEKTKRFFVGIGLVILLGGFSVGFPLSFKANCAQEEVIWSGCMASYNFCCTTKAWEPEDDIRKSHSFGNLLTKEEYQLWSILRSHFKSLLLHFPYPCHMS